MNDTLVRPPASQTNSAGFYRKATSGVAACGVFAAPLVVHGSLYRAPVSTKRDTTAVAANWEFRQSASAAQGTIADLEPSAAIDLLLKVANLKADRISLTSRKSKMYQFFGGTHACLDVYPSGKVLVLIDRGTHDDMYRFELSNVGAIAKLLKNEGVHGRV